MADKSSTVLLAGIGRGPFEAVAPVLERHQMEVTRTETLEEAASMGRSTRFDLIVLDAEPNHLTLTEIVGALRGGASASLASSIMVVTDQQFADAALDLVGRGVNRVVLLGEDEETIERHVADLLDIAPRAAVRFAARLSAVLDDGTLEVIGQTVNLSATGMLVQSATILEPGQRVIFDISVPETGDKVSGEAEIVRHATSERGGVDGVGVRFLEFFGDGRERVGAMLSEALVGL